MAVNLNNLKSRVQARINAVTAGTPLRDLLLLRKSANGLQCDLTPLETQLANKISNFTEGADVRDLLLANKAATDEQRPVETITAPIDLASGDTLYLNCFGEVYKNQPDDTRILTATAGAPLVSRNMRLRVGGLTPGALQNQCGFCFRLADGNLLLATGQSIENQYGLSLRVIAADFNQTMSYATLQLRAGDGSSNYYAQLFGCYEISPNTFRVYYVCHYNGTESTPYNLYHQTIVYNPANRQLSVTSSATQLYSTGSASQAIQQKTVPSRQGERYLTFAAYEGAVYRNRCLDMSNGAITEYTGLSNASVSYFSPYDLTGTEQTYSRVINGSTVALYKAGANQVVGLPANLQTDGCFGTSWLQLSLGNGHWLCHNNNTGQLKLVVFNPAYSSCQIHLIANHPLLIGSNVSQLAAIAEGQNYLVFANGQLPPFTFSIAAGGAPADFRFEARFPQAVRQQLQPDWQRVVPASQRLITLYTVQSSSSSIWTDLIFCWAAADAMPYRAQALARCRHAASAGQPVLVELLPGTTVAETESAYRLDKKSLQQLRQDLTVQMDRFQFARVYGSQSSHPLLLSISARMLTGSSGYWNSTMLYPAGVKSFGTVSGSFFGVYTAYGLMFSSSASGTDYLEFDIKMPCVLTVAGSLNLYQEQSY